MYGVRYFGVWREQTLDERSVSARSNSRSLAMYRPNFSVATGVLVALVALGAIVKLLNPLVPPAAPNDLAGSRDDFLIQGSREPIDWKVIGDSAFAQALHDQKPILFVVGAPWSSFARGMDAAVFRDPDVARYLNRNFVCVRVDASAERKWLGAYLPYSRITYGVLPGFQAWVLDSRGRMLDLVGRVSADQELDADTFLAALIDARSLIDRLSRDLPTPILPDQAQRSDLSVLRQSPRRILPRFGQYTLDLLKQVQPKFGGFPRHGIQVVQPNAWKYLVLTGHALDAQDALDPVLFSPLTDLVDGGFFRLSANDDQRNVDFDKIATVNAESAQSLALMQWATGDDVYGLFGKRAYDSVLDTMVDADGLVRTCRTGNVGRDQRSDAHSFGLARIAATLSGSDAQWARDHLGLEPSTNPQMVPFIASRPILATDPTRRNRILRALGASVSEPDPSAGQDSAEAHGHTVARLFEAARYWGGEARFEELGLLADAAESFRKEDRIVPRPDSNRPSDYLGDWLAYADVELQDFLVNGRVVSLDHGASVLEKALMLFEGEAPGEYFASLPNDKPLGPQNAAAPEVCDNVQESCAARVIRLCAAYGDLLCPSERGMAFKRRAYAASDLYSTSLQEGGPSVAGYFCACYGLKADAYAFAVGPRAVSDANELYRRVPTHLIAPAIGPVGVQLRNREPGFYVFRMGKPSGPFGLDEAARLLSPSRATARRTRP